jgi:hypothetical protein
VAVQRALPGPAGQRPQDAVHGARVPGRGSAPVGRWTERCNTGLTPADTRGEGFQGATGVTENEKTPGNPGVFHFVLPYEDPALTTELRRQGGRSRASS